MKIIFVTGGVISWLGKWIAASSIAKIMKSCGYSVTMMKLDPYLQIDAGTMSPFEHGETFVTIDGFETDLDLGHYERFINQNLTSKSSVTTGQIYLSVINQEREGKFLGKTVQVIPHITDEIKNRILEVGKEKDLTIIEIWGTIGDIEWPHFIETARQLRQEFGRENVLFVHVVPILQVSTSGELKTKAIQHSVIKMREMGLYPDILVCRTKVSIEEDLKSKIWLFCGLDKSNIIEWLDMKSIYSVPLVFEKQWISRIIQKQLFTQFCDSDLSNWSDKVDKILNSEKTTHIAIAGKYTNLDDSYISVIEALRHSGTVFGTKIKTYWIDTEKYESSDRQDRLQTFISENDIKWIVVPWWFGNRGVEGKINIANFARKNNIPYLWLCLGMQVAVIGFAREIIMNNEKWIINNLVWRYEIDKMDENVGQKYFFAENNEEWKDKNCENRSVRWEICGNNNSIPLEGLSNKSVKICEICEKKDLPKDILSLVSSTEFCADCNHPVIDYMANQKNITAKWWTMRLWHFPAILLPNSQTLEIYKKYGKIYNGQEIQDIIWKSSDEIFLWKIWQEDLAKIQKSDNIVFERHRHRYEVNPKYHELLSANGLVFAGKSPDGSLVEFIEFTNHKFFLATQAHPELQSRLESPHPLFVWFMQSCIQ